MSRFVRRVECKIAILESKLKRAREELVKEKALDVVRAKEKIERAAAKCAEKKAARDANPQQVYFETKMLLLSLCIERNLRFREEQVTDYFRWKTTVEFPPKTTRYQKLIRFLKEKEEVKGIPIFAKTMTGELIPLVYHADRDKRDLQLQLAKVDSEQFPLGSTNIVRLVEDPNAPVEPEEIVGLYQNGIRMVSYSSYSSDLVRAGFTNKTSNKCCICYALNVSPMGIVPHERMKFKYDERIVFEYFYETQEISCYGQTDAIPLREIRTLLEQIAIRSYQTINIKTKLTEQAQEELIALFETIRRDNF